MKAKENKKKPENKVSSVTKKDDDKDKADKNACSDYNQIIMNMLKSNADQKKNAKPNAVGSITIDIQTEIEKNKKELISSNANSKEKKPKLIFKPHKKTNSIGYDEDSTNLRITQNKTKNISNNNGNVSSTILTNTQNLNIPPIKKHSDNKKGLSLREEKSNISNNSKDKTFKNNVFSPLIKRQKIDINLDEVSKDIKPVESCINLKKANSKIKEKNAVSKRNSICLLKSNSKASSIKNISKEKEKVDKAVEKIDKLEIKINELKKIDSNFEIDHEENYESMNIELNNEIEEEDINDISNINKKEKKMKNKFVPTVKTQLYNNLIDESFITTNESFVFEIDGKDKKDKKLPFTRIEKIKLKNQLVEKKSIRDKKANITNYNQTSKSKINLTANTSISKISKQNSFTNLKGFSSKTKLVDTKDSKDAKDVTSTRKESEAFNVNNINDLQEFNKQVIQGFKNNYQNEIQSNLAKLQQKLKVLNSEESSPDIKETFKISRLSKYKCSNKNVIDLTSLTKDHTDTKSTKNFKLIPRKIKNDEKLLSGNSSYSHFNTLILNVKNDSLKLNNSSSNIFSSGLQKNKDVHFSNNNFDINIIDTNEDENEEILESNSKLFSLTAKQFNTVKPSNIININNIINIFPGDQTQSTQSSLSKVNISNKLKQARNQKTEQKKEEELQKNKITFVPTSPSSLKKSDLNIRSKSSASKTNKQEVLDEIVNNLEKSRGRKIDNLYLEAQLNELNSKSISPGKIYGELRNKVKDKFLEV